MKIINKEYLASLDPCSDRWENYNKHYESFSGTITEFIELDNISFYDKKWVLFRDNGLLPDKLMREFALICACRAVEDADIEELNYYFDLILHMSESGEDLRGDEEYIVADRAADSASYWAACWAAYWAACWASHRAAYWAADWAAEEGIQKDILLNLVEEYKI